MAGNTIAAKHAGNVPQCALAFEALWEQAGAPTGLYTNLFVSHDQSDKVVDDACIRGVALTGSVEAGRSLAVRAGQNLKPSCMELGGSNAFIVLEDIAPTNPAFRDEFFGPVAMIFRVKDEEKAIALANDSDFGLGGSVFTKIVARGRRIASRIETGMMFINNISWADADLP